MNIGDLYTCVQDYAPFTAGDICQVESITITGVVLFDISHPSSKGIFPSSCWVLLFFIPHVFTVAAVPNASSLQGAFPPPKLLPILSYVDPSASGMFSNFGEEALAFTKETSICECGAHSINLNHHSSWCPMNGKE